MAPYEKKSQLCQFVAVAVAVDVVAVAVVAVDVDVVDVAVAVVVASDVAGVNVNATMYILCSILDRDMKFGLNGARTDGREHAFARCSVCQH